MSLLTSDLLLAHMSDAVIALDDQLRIREMNGPAALLYRRKQDQVLGRSLVELFPELTGTGAIDQLHAARTGRIPRRIEIFVPSLFAWHAGLAVPAQGGLVLFARDVSDRVRREGEEAARAAVRKVIESMPLCVTITRGPQHRIEQANRLARSLVGNREAEGELVERVLPEAREQGFIAILDAVYASGEAYRGEEVSLHWKPHPEAEERVAWFDLTYQPLMDESGNVSGILHLGTEVSEKVQRRRLIERYASERQAVLEQLDEGVILTDAQGRITFVNDAAERMHGVKLLGVGPGEYTAAYSLLTDAGEPHPPEQLPLSRAVRERLAVQDAVWKIQRADGTVLRVRGNAKPVFTDG
ncbi:MAG TPA: PAS domain-containing protein, partial [Ramlibacter sp.]|nr:PAS domain-containing protein [Ramlibacter sp.]